MLALKIIGGLLLLLFLALLPSVRVWALAENGSIRVSAHYLFFRVRLYPLPEKPAKPGRAEAAKEKDEKKEPKEKKSWARRREEIRLLFSASKKALRLLCRHLVIYKVRGSVTIARPDAHQTAVAYAKSSLLLSSLSGLLDRLFVLKRPEIILIPGFSAAASAYRVSLRARIRPVFVLAAGARMLSALLRARRKKPKRQKRAAPA